LQLGASGDLHACWCRLSGYYLRIRIVLQSWPSGHDHGSALPWPAFKQEGNFLFFPLPVQLFFFLPISSPEAASGFKVVTLHPDRSVNEVRQRLTR
jgi:hypothetical protein